VNPVGCALFGNGRSRRIVIEKAGFSFAGFPKVQAYLDTCRARPTWKETPKLPML